MIALPTRYRCTACGNLTRFDVTETRSTRAFHHYTVGGDLEIEDVEVLSQHIESVSCRWCGTGGSVVTEAVDFSESIEATETINPALAEAGGE